MRKNIYRLTTIITFVVISLLAFSITTNFMIKKEKELFEKKYNSFSFNIQDKINSLIAKKKNATLALTITLANNTDVLKLLNKTTEEDKKLHDLSLLLRKETDFKNVWFQVINKDGISLYRSWSKKRNDELYKVREDLRMMIKEPKIRSTISVGKYDITFKAMVPIYENGKFIGIIESITHFNSISRGLRKTDSLEPIIIVEKSFTKQLKKNAFTDIFVQNHYVANLSVNDKLLNYLEKEDLDKFLKIDKFILDNNKIVVNSPIFFNNKKLANFLVFKDIDDIDTSYIEEYKQNIYLYLGLFIVLIGLVLFIISYYLYSNELKKLYTQLSDNQEELHELNNSLVKTVDMEVSKNYEKNKILFQQSKMAAMGEMIGNIAHQWRQPLSIITTAASGMKLKKELDILKDEDYIESLDMIVNSANYLSSTIDDFRNFFSPNKEKTTFTSNELLEKVFSLIEKEFNTKDIEIKTSIQNIEIYSYKNELLQVLINLLNNARDELVKIDDIQKRKLIFIDISKLDSSIILKIKDNAGGIAENIIDRIFEPYFTTKHKSQGTGIGLFMSDEIITKHMEGILKVQNVKYNYKNIEYYGAEFIITLPL